jgi:hypothetical protein
MSNLKDFLIYKKRDGQSFKEVGSIYTDNFENAKKEFAENMTKGNWEKSNDVVWLDNDADGVGVTGWYDFGGGRATFNEETEKYDADEAEDFLLVSDADIKEGFSSWSEDVFTWEVRNNK